MKKLLYSTLALGACLLAATPPAHAEDVQHFFVRNTTDHSFKEMYVSQANQSNWGDNLLEKPVDKDQFGEIALDMDYPGIKGVCKWDIKFVDTEGQPFVVSGFDFCGKVRHFKVELDNGKLDWQDD